MLKSEGAAAGGSTPGASTPGASTAEKIDENASKRNHAAPFLPSQTRLQSPAWGGKALGDSQQCSGCHETLYRQWRNSAHALSSFNNPLYRNSVEHLRRTAGAESSRHCGGCHDPALLVDGGLDSAIEPKDARAYAGVSCLTCHATERSGAEGNGSYTLGPQLSADVLHPEGQEAVARHRAALSPPNGAGQLCGSCHRSFLDSSTGNLGHVAGMDDLGAWQRSAWAGPSTQRLSGPGAARQSCQGCHMPKHRTAGGQTLASHQFLGGHTWLHRALGDASALEAASSRMTGAVGLWLRPSVGERRGRALSADAEPQGPPAPGLQFTLDVTLQNQGVGHHFPGGTKDLADTWLEVNVVDAQGRPLLRSAPKRTDDPDPMGDEGLHRLLALTVDREGLGVWTHETSRLVGVARDTTLATHAPQVVRYVGVVPRGALGPLRVTAELKHRSRNRRAAIAACEAQSTAAGRRIRRAATARGPYFDACTPQPVTRVARAQTSVAINRPGRATAPASTASSPRQARVDELWASGMLTSAPGELLERPRAVLESHLNQSQLPPQLRASLRLTAARLHAALGRYAAARRLLLPLNSDAPPALWAAVGDLEAAAWRFQPAALAYAQVAKAAPQDPTGWARWAASALSAGRLTEAESAARAGLRRAPLVPALLRTLALSQRNGSTAASARAAHLARLEPARATRARRLCQRRRADCLPHRFALALQPAVGHEAR